MFGKAGMQASPVIMSHPSPELLPHPVYHWYKRLTERGK
jgi:hypothetical protein